MLAGTAIIVLLVAAPPAPDDIARARQEVLSDSSYQTTWPDEERLEREPDESAGERPNRRRRWEPQESRGSFEGGPGTGEPRFRRNPRSSRTDSSFDGRAVTHTLLWLVAAVVLALLVMALARAWRRAPQDIEPKPEAPTPPRPAPAALARPLTEAERLAAEGRFAEAVHVLLLETIQALSAHTEGGLAHSLTSREVLERGYMSDPAREAMRGLVQTVERSLFGNRAVDQVEYEHCTAAFNNFRAAYESAAS